jgi:tRNA A-37 threonylcarbamoyl transferase component Bud32
LQLLHLPTVHSPVFISPDFADVLAHNQLNTFAQLWAKNITWFEQPNQRRGGWSGVGRLQLVNSNRKSQTFYLKKQQNHGRRTWQNPIAGEPTFRREFVNLQLLAAHHFAAPQVAFYAEATENGQQCAVLMTAELVDFKDLAELSDTWLPSASRAQKAQLIKKIANEIKRFHSFGLVHRALYPKHIFIKNVDANPEIALIDLEKVRKNTNANTCAVFDLAAFNRHSVGWRNTQRLAFLKQYLQAKKLDAAGKKLARNILQRAGRK